MRSVLDTADLALVRSAARGLPGPFATVVACLRAGGVLQHDPDDPAWPDRDRLFATAGSAEEAVAAAWPAAAMAEPAPGTPGATLGVAVGAGIGSALDGGIFRVWCLLGWDAAEDGALWGAARTAVRARCGLVTVVLTGAAEPSAGAEASAELLSAAGWALQPCDMTDPVEVLGAMDQAIARTLLPTALVGRVA